MACCCEMCCNGNGKRKKDSCCCRCCLAVSRRIPIFVIVVSMIWCYYAYVVYFCIYGLSNLGLQVVCIVFFHLLFLMLVWCYIKALFTVSKKVPAEYYVGVDVLTRQNNNPDYFNKCAEVLSLHCCASGGALRSCVTCQCFKPDRTHHCSTCNTCVVKMDHHCPWLNNCVSFTNYKYFLLTLIYTFFFTLFVFCTIFPQTINFFSVLGQSGQDMLDVQYPILLLTAFIYCLCVTMLLIEHLRLVSRNRTTLEHMRAPIFYDGVGGDRFNMGCRANFREVFGRKWYKWFFPVFSSEGDGVTFTITKPGGGNSSQSKSAGSLIPENSPLLATQSYPVQPPANSEAEKEIVPVKVDPRFKSRSTAEGMPDLVTVRSADSSITHDSKLEQHGS